MDHTDDVIISAQARCGEECKYCTCIEKQAEQPIVALGPRDMIGRKFCGTTPDDINTYKCF